MRFASGWSFRKWWSVTLNLCESKILLYIIFLWHSSAVFLQRGCYCYTHTIHSVNLNEHTKSAMERCRAGFSSMLPISYFFTTRKCVFLSEASNLLRARKVKWMGVPIFPPFRARGFRGIYSRFSQKSLMQMSWRANTKQNIVYSVRKILTKRKSETKHKRFLQPWWLQNLDNGVEQTKGQDHILFGQVWT